MKWLLLGGAAAYLLTRKKSAPVQARKARSLTEDEETAYDLVTLDETELAVDAHDAGELYGMHVPRAAETHVLDDDRAFEDGQNWLEALETSAAENGAEPEAEIVLIDEQDDAGHFATESADRPIADLGSAGPRGL